MLYISPLIWYNNASKGGEIHVRARGKRTADLESYLESLLFDYKPEYLEGSKLALPPLMFQAIFLIEHACGHFLYEKMSIKNIFKIWPAVCRKKLF